MKIKQRKGIYALIVVMIVFLAVAVFTLSNTKKSSADTGNSGLNLPGISALSDSGEVEYTLTIQGEGSITADVEGEKTVFSDDDILFGDFNQEIVFFAEDHYKFTSAEVNWNGSVVKINGENVSSAPKTVNDLTYLRIQPSGESVDAVTITFNLEKIAYPIIQTAKYIENFALLKENKDAENTEIIITDGEGDPVSSVMVDGYINLQLDDENLDLNRKFIGYAFIDTLSGEYGEIFTNDSLQIDAVFLADHLLSSKQIELAAVYVRTYSVTLNIDNDYLDFIEIAVNNFRTDGNVFTVLGTGNSKSIREFFSEPIEEGYSITMSLKNHRYYMFNGFTVDSFENADAEDAIDISGNGCNISYLAYEYEIDIGFEKESYQIELAAVDNLNLKLNDFLTAQEDLDLSGFILEINGEAVDITQLSALTFKLDDTIRIEISAELLAQMEGLGYFFNNISIRGNEYTVFDEKATYEFLENCLDLNSGGISFVINFFIRYQFSITLSGNGYGEYSVQIGENGAPKTYTSNFDAQYYNNNTVIKIKVIPGKYSNWDSNAYDLEEKDGGTIEIVLNGSRRERNINIVFELKTFSLADQTDAGTSGMKDYEVSSLENLKLNDRVIITFSAPQNKEIKTWLINGNDVLGGELAGAEYSKGVLTITLDEYWLGVFEKDGGIKNEITTGATLSYLMMIIIPSVAVPVLALVLIILMISNARKKKFIKEELLTEKMTGYTYDTGSMIEALREDTFRKVSKEDVKAKMKKDKKSK